MAKLKALILGGSGFVGTNLIKHLAAYYDVSAPPKTKLDVMALGQLNVHLQAEEPDVVIDLAAHVGGIGVNRDQPAEMIYRNLQMSLNVVHACWTNRINKLIYIGSVCAYPHTPLHIPFIEDDLWCGRPEATNEPYGVAKKTIGLMLDAYWRQYGFKSAYLIPTNMYGPYDNFDPYSSHVIPAMILKYLNAVKRQNLDGPMGRVVHWGDGSASREFLYVTDCCEAIRLAIEKVDEPMPINVGSGVETNMGTLGLAIAGVVGYQGEVVWDSSKPNGQPRRCLDVSAAERILGFKAKVGLEDGLRRTIDWYVRDG